MSAAMTRTATIAGACALVLAAGAAGAAPPAHADDRGDGRVAGRCSRGAAAELRLQSRDGAIRIELRVRRRPAGEAWRVVLVHERRVVSRKRVRTSGSSGGFRVRRSVRDFDGPDEVTARATGPRGLTCVAAATLSG